MLSKLLAYTLIRPDFYQNYNRRTGFTIQRIRQCSMCSSCDILRASDSGYLAIPDTTGFVSSLLHGRPRSVASSTRRVSYGLGGAVFRRFESYIDGRTYSQFVRCRTKRHPRLTRVKCGGCHISDRFSYGPDTALHGSCCDLVSFVHGGLINRAD